MITIIAIGKKHEPWLVEGINRYQKRLSAPFNLSWTLLANSPQKGTVAVKNESDDILNKLKSGDFVIFVRRARQNVRLTYPGQKVDHTSRAI